MANVLDGQPEPPKYFATMKRLNKAGAPRAGRLRLAAAGSTTDRLSELLAERAIVVDTRPAAEYAAAHLPGTINIPLTQSFVTWAGWLLPYDTDLYFIVDDPAESHRGGARAAAGADWARPGRGCVRDAEAVRRPHRGAVCSGVPQMSA